MKKKVTCALILTDGRLFLSVKPTGGTLRDIPKGMQEKGETYLDTVIREVKEETGFDAANYKCSIQRIGEFPYTTEKNIFVFLLCLPRLPYITTYMCTSTYNNGDGEKPEVGDFKYCTLDHLHKFKKPTQLIIAQVMEKFIN